MQPGSTSTADDVDTLQDDAPGHARQWWGERELAVERELAAGMQRRMETQRAQLYAFKTEQSKWEHELQLRISKYTHDRKLLSEHNVELQGELAAVEEKLGQYEREMDLQVQYAIELEGMLQEKQMDAQQLWTLRQENKELQQRLRQWERFYRDEKIGAAREQQAQQEELLTELERLLVLPPDKSGRREHAGGRGEIKEGATSHDEQVQHDTDGRQRKTDAEDESLVTRVKELEALCEQKDQSVFSLKSIVEQQEVAFDEKLKIVTAKYDQIKAINMALQKRLMQTLTEASGKS
uniref:Uncharacterized protein n=1 Tax=Peronospora matthiolae TaxID=2874970 RepID=A0AAV1UKW2_9STRA